MFTFFMVVLIVLGVLVMLGAIIVFVSLCGLAGALIGGAAARMLSPPPEVFLTDADNKRIDRLIRSTRKMAGLPPIN